MSASQSLGGTSRCGRVVGPSLDKIIKNAAWRKHSHLVSACKSTLDKLESISDSSTTESSSSVLLGLSSSDAESVLQPLYLALDSAYPKVVEPALECTFKLFSLGLVRAEIETSSESGSGIVLNMINAICKSAGIGDEAIELGVLRVLLSAVRSPCILIRSDSLIQIVRTCYNIYLGGVNGTNQICAKSVLAQIITIVFTRVEQDSLDVSVQKVSVTQLLEFTDKNLNEGNSINFCQNFISDIVDPVEGVPHKPYSVSSKAATDNETDPEAAAAGGGSKIREDGFLLFKNLCKLSMKFSSQQHPDDRILLRGKILSLELLKVVMDNAGSLWRVNERFLNAIKQYLCLSLLKNSALSAMTIFQLQCSIFMNLLSKFRSALKKEIGMFFPMLILRVLENVLQPSFLQKMTVLSLLEKISQDPHIIIDIFVNYDCDVDASNIFERIVNGLLKTALGPPTGSTTALSPAQDITFRHESVKCLASIIKSMGTWMDQQIRIGDLYLAKNSESGSPTENHLTLNGEEGNTSDYELHSDLNFEFSDAATLEQRRAYKIELQKGISLFNRKPSKGIEFLISNNKIVSSPEEVALFLKNTACLDETKIGDYLGEREEFSLKVMHAYVDSFNFKGIDFGEAIRFFLRGFRLPGEAQKIDRIMEKFAERYCKCNPSSFSSADTAYVLAYSVIMLNTDAHNNMVKDKMAKADFIRNNRGIDDGKDLPEEYLGGLYDHVVKNEIKMNADSSAPQSKQANSFNRLLGLDGILNLVNWKQNEEKAVGANGLLIRHIQEQFKSNSGKSESAYHVVTDVAILRFMVEVCWGPMLAAFSVMLDQSDDRLATSQCLQGFRHAVHVTAVMGMQTQRDAFVTSVAKFTYLHCAADMKQKNVDAVKAMISIAIEDGDYLHEAWEHILTCLSRIEHLQLLGEGAPSDSTFFTSSSFDAAEKTPKTLGFSSFKKGTLQNPAMLAVVRGGSYDSTSVGVNASALVTPEQINNFISNLNILDQIGNFELNHVFAHSQRLNGEAIVAFVKALCKVSISELQSPTDPRVFGLTKIVEIAHYNMNRIRLVWSRIWNVLSDFFVSVGLSENLSVAIFAMDSLRQLAMKFLEREELANYNFQNEFLRPFALVMQKSNSTEIRELIVRCISHMVLSRVSNVKSGWKSVFMVFTAAAADERKNIVLLAFETMEKIVREFFPYITETETMTFTDCVRCLLTFTNSRFNSDVSLNAIAFLRFCAVRLADGGLVFNKNSNVDGSSVIAANGVSCLQTCTDKDDHVSFWNPLLSGLSKLTSDPRSAIRKSSLEVLFNILKDHGHLFSRTFWDSLFCSVIFPVYNSVSGKRDVSLQEGHCSPSSVSVYHEGVTWDSETSSVAAQCLIDLFVTFFDTVRSQLPGVVSVLIEFIRSPIQGPASTGVAGLVRLTGDLGSRLSEEEWKEIFLRLKEAVTSTVPGFMKVLKTMNNIEVPKISHFSDHEVTMDELNDDNLQTAIYVVSRTKNHIAMQLLILQVSTDLYKMHQQSLSPTNLKVLIELYSSIALHARQLNSESILLKKLQKACSILELSGPPMVHFENESFQSHLNFLQNLLARDSSVYDEIEIEPEFVAVCENVLDIYLNCAGSLSSSHKSDTQPVPCRKLPLSSAKKEEIAARTSLVISALQGLGGLKKDSFRRYIPGFFQLLVDLMRSEHTSGEVQLALSDMFRSSIGPIIME
ncbi:putative Sec7 domain, mon2, dimerization and cyclophilin-binding domain-containing protein [Lupinus albus]|uniref:Putative Sec7 domain, mon2, dimerization and cyclophilin-binding domain-containing protein n=1 Tax=Lupinus albus TaxID=3870 RepID=A0A6A4QKZ5_LUPAL|nr:putative Sec7 domain, mon2, dimerization and cyclophilin-binding domain-containing protein [Lupinus albus]